MDCLRVWDTITRVMGRCSPVKAMVAPMTIEWENAYCAIYGVSSSWSTSPLLSHRGPVLRVGLVSAMISSCPPSCDLMSLDTVSGTVVGVASAG